MMDVFVIYDRPPDHPEQFILGGWVISAGKIKYRGVWGAGETADQLRALIPAGYVKLGRYPQDDPCILETWICPTHGPKSS